MNVVLGSVYWPNLHYVYYLIHAQTAIIDLWEHFEKQSYRNRTQILSANGALNLTIPVKKHKDHTPLKLIEISYAENWQKQHLRALTSAYNNSPFYTFLEDEIAEFYKNEYRYLHELNAAQLVWLLKVFRLKTTITYSESYIEKVSHGNIDLRANIHPKNESINFNVNARINKPYYQTFESKFNFMPNLSVLDYLFNEGIKIQPYLIA